MLLGPPGVGKTYAVKAVKHLCKEWCKVRDTFRSHCSLLSSYFPVSLYISLQIHIVELSIPMLLSDANPCARLDHIISTIARLHKLRVVSDSSTTASVPSTPQQQTPVRGGAIPGGSTPTPGGGGDVGQKSPVPPGRTPLKYSGAVLTH